ncbi:MAG TPA: serine/threonine-protein kinase [Vicinamibacteria bacterium]|nr:serine/threonine-protein kinase [Vicinamibacteria bacterium]
MAKDKDDSPLSSNVPRELEVGRGEVRQKFRQDIPKGQGDLLTSKDLFGEIIDELGDDGRAVSREGAASPSPMRADTVSMKAEADGEKVYSIVDLAYSTLLHDSKLNRQVETGGAAPETEPAKADSAYGQYLLLDRIATGGMAEVFRAKRRGVEGFEKTVAVKRILPHLSDNKEFVEMFINEAKMVAGLSHPNIVQIFDLGKIENTYYIAMEYIEGMDLRAILARLRGKETILNVDLSALIATRVASALEYAHRHRDASGKPLQIVHRDVSPPNILISREGEVKLVDFGIAKAAIKAHSTDSGSLRGKLLYMSPEQAWGRSLDKRSDIFSLGVVLFEILAGRSLFMSTSEMSILERVREAHFLTPSSFNPAIPIELEAVVAKSLKKEPDDRYQDASEMLRDLDAYLRRRPAVGAAELAGSVERLFAPGAGEESKWKTNPGTVA